MEEISPNNILKVSHISASYQEGKQRKTVLHDISFELHENEILGLVGESGCGKSTLSKVILGFIRSDAEGSERRTKKTGSCDGRKSRPLRRAPETPPA